MKLRIIGILLAQLTVFQMNSMSWPVKLKQYLNLSSKKILKDEDILINHIAVMQELKQRNAAKAQSSTTHGSMSGLTQTEAHLKIYSPMVAHYFKEHAWLKPSLEKLIQQEKIYDQTHYVFYHSQLSKLSIMQDFLKEVYQLLQMEKIHDFVFLRNPHQLPSKDEAQKFLDENMPVWDAKIEMSRRLLSVNLAFFGNINAIRYGECTFDFLIRGTNVHNPDIPNILLQVFTDLKMDFENSKKLLKLSTDLASKHGVLLQIFVPKDNVDECVYLSGPFGVPFGNSILPQYFDSARQRHTRLAPILDYYKAHPEKITELDALQARIVFDKAIMLNPKSGVKIIRYGGLNEQVNKEYKEKVRQIALDAVKSRLKQGGELPPVNPEMGKAPLQRLQEYRAQCKAKL